MTGPDELRRENKTLRERISRLSSAILRINSSLDVNTVLHEILESARALTHALNGVIATIDDSGQVQDRVVSGLNPEQQQLLENSRDGVHVFEHFRNIPETLRLRDLPDYVRSLGCSADLAIGKTLQCTPMLHRDVHVGTCFLSDKEGSREITSEDEEVLVMFGSQAAPKNMTAMRTLGISTRMGFLLSCGWPRFS